MTDQTPAAGGDGEDIEIDFLAIAAKHLPTEHHAVPRPANWRCSDCDTWNDNHDRTCMVCDCRR